MQLELVVHSAVRELVGDGLGVDDAVVMHDTELERVGDKEADAVHVHVRVGSEVAVVVHAAVVVGLTVGVGESNRVGVVEELNVDRGLQLPLQVWDTVALETALIEGVALGVCFGVLDTERVSEFVAVLVKETPTVDVRVCVAVPDVVADGVTVGDPVPLHVRQGLQVRLEVSDACKLFVALAVSVMVRVSVGVWVGVTVQEFVVEQAQVEVGVGDAVRVIL